MFDMVQEASGVFSSQANVEYIQPIALACKLYIWEGGALARVGLKLGGCKGVQLRDNRRHRMWLGSPHAEMTPTVCV